jgi:hypothetical protein
LVYGALIFAFSCGCSAEKEKVEPTLEDMFTLYELKASEGKSGVDGLEFRDINGLRTPGQNVDSEQKLIWISDSSQLISPRILIIGGEYRGIYQRAPLKKKKADILMRLNSELPEGPVLPLNADFGQQGQSLIYSLSNFRFEPNQKDDLLELKSISNNESPTVGLPMPVAGDVHQLIVADILHAGIPKLIAATETGLLVFEQDASGELPQWTEVSGYTLPEARFLGKGLLVRDFDHDGWSDIYAFDSVRDESDVLFSGKRNGTLGPATEKKFRLPQGIHSRADAADLNNDGLTDVVLASDSGLRVFMNGGIGQFSETTGIAGLSDVSGVQGMLLADFDNDGHKDLLIVCADDSLGTEGEWHTRFFGNLGSGQFKETTTEWFPGGKIPGGHVALTDFDRDGDLDVFINGPRGVYWLKNNISRENEWLRMEVKGPPGNPMAEGAKVVLFVGNEIRYHEISATNGMNGGSELMVHFGAKELSSIDSLLVLFPDRYAVKKHDIATRQTIEINHSEAIKQPYRIFQFARPPFSSSNLGALGIEARGMAGVPVAVGDFNGDGLPGMFIGGSKGRPGMLFQQSEDGMLEPLMMKLFLADAKFNDSSALFFDADSDGDLDLFVGTTDGPDRLYLNDGNGNYTKSAGKLPTEPYDTYEAKSFERKQGAGFDLVLLTDNIGLRILTGKKGRFVDETETRCPGCASYGRVRALEFLESQEAIVITETGELRMIQILPDGIWMEFQSKVLEGLYGQWCGLGLADIDGDGIQEVLLGNVGLNAKIEDPYGYRESGILTKKDFDWAFKPLPPMAQIGPIRCFLARDFDGDGAMDLLAAGNFAPLNSGNGFFISGIATENPVCLPGIKSGVYLPGNVGRMVFLPGDFSNERALVFYDDEEPLVLNCRP